MNKCRWFQTYASWLDTRLLMVLQFFLLMILMATRCKSGILKPSLTSPFAPHPNSLLTVYLLVSTVGKVSVWGSVDMKTYTFFLAPAKQISALWSRGHMASFPILCPLTQVPLELLSFKKIPLLFLIISHWTLETVVPRTRISQTHIQIRAWLLRRSILYRFKVATVKQKCMKTCFASIPAVTNLAASDGVTI